MPIDVILNGFSIDRNFDFVLLWLDHKLLIYMRMHDKTCALFWSSILMMSLFDCSKFAELLYYLLFFLLVVIQNEMIWVLSFLRIFRNLFSRAPHFRNSSRINYRSQMKMLKLNLCWDYRRGYQANISIVSNF